MLKMTGVELELISDTVMYFFVEKDMRGIFYIAERYSKGSEKYMKSFDDSKPNKYITYLNANNLYGWEMSQYLPYGRFNCLSQKDC